MDTRTAFDYYLDHPYEYITVAGQPWSHTYGYTAPLSDLRIVFTAAVLLYSLMRYVYQYYKHKKYMAKIENLVRHNFGQRHGGTYNTMELYRRASKLYLASDPTGIQRRVGIKVSIPHSVPISFILSTSLR